MQMVKTTEHHPLYGDIQITINPRARRITLRARDGFICITMPPYTPRKVIDDALAQHGSRLLAECRTQQPDIIDGDYKFVSDNFCFSLEASATGKPFLRFDGKSATLHYPTGTDLTSPTTQEWLRRVRVTALRRVAAGYLPQRLKELATRHGFTYSRVTLRDSHSRWGSCSNRGSISLSIYLQLLPPHLSDYVLLHELCHTVEMNHGERFWVLMDSITNCSAKGQREALKGFKTCF